MPRLCVLIPVRNAEAYVARAVSSVLRALPRDASLTVFDDCSTDRTATVLQHIMDPRVTVILSAEHVGRIRGANLLLERTDSEFIARMDGDDITTPWRFGFQQRLLERRALDATFMTMAELQGRKVRPSMPMWISPESFALHLLITNPVGQPTLFARRAAIDQVGGYRDVTAEDYDLWLRLAQDGARLHRSAVPGLLYRQHAQQTTASSDYKPDSWSDSLIQEAYKDLCETVLGVRLPRLVSVASDPAVSRTELDEHIKRLTSGLNEHARILAGIERWYLDRTLAARVRHAYAVFERRPR